MNEVEKRVLNQGLDMDSSVRLMENGTYRYGYNLRVGITDNDNFQNVERTAGNTLIPNADLPAGDNITIGRYEDTVANHLYFFNYNSLGQHGIYRLELDSQSITTVLVDPLLNFNPDYLITGIDVAYIDIDQPILGWTDGGAPNTLSPTVIYNPPRQLDVNKAIAYSQGDFVNGYPAITVEVLDQIKYPPKFSPAVQMVDDQTYGKNNLRGKLPQFKYRYVYQDFSKSAWSPISEVANPVHQQIIDNVTYLPFYFDNRVDVTLAQGSIICTAIEIAVRFENSANTDFYLWRTVSNFLTPTATFSFYNDEVLDALEINESNKLYDDVPRVAKAETIIAGNRRVWSNVVNQFNLVQPDIFLTNIQQSLSDPQTLLGSITSTTTLWIPNIPPPLVLPITVQLVTLPSPFTYPVGTVMQLDGDPNTSYVVSQADINNPATFVSNVVAYLNTIFPNDEYSVAYGYGYVLPSGLPLLSNQFVVLTVGVLFTPQLTFNFYSFESGYSNWLSGFNKTFGLVYYDRANRSSSVITDDTFNIQVPSVQGSLGAYLKRNFIGWGIDHVPPDWATHYQWVARYTAPLSFIDFSIKSVANVGTQTQINLTPIIDYSTQFPSSILTYSYTTGDRCQFLTTQTGVPYPQFIDVAVNAFDEGTNILSVDQVDITGLVITAGTLIRIYTPQPTYTEEQTIFYEFSQQYEIGDAGLPTRYHKGETQDQIVGTQPATGIFDRGDVWIRPRRMSTVNNSTFQNYWVEDANFSDFYSSDVWDKGRPNIYDKDFRETNRPTTTFYSQPFIPETNINGLGSVFPENFGSDDLQVLLKYGEINYIYSDGKDLVIFQKLKTGFIPINYRVAFDGAQQTIVGQTDAVLNQIVYYAGEYGIGNHPEAFAYYGYGKYFPDTLRGVSCRLSNDGITEISKIYKLHNFTSDKFGEIQAFPVKINMWGAYDRRHQEYVYAPQDKTYNTKTFDGYTLAFSEAINKWTTFYGYMPDCIGSLGLDLVSFKNGECYMHLQNSPYANFYGVQQDSHIVVPSNARPSESKVYMNTSVECNKALEAPEITTSEGNLSNLILSDFENTEGKWYAGFWFDQNTPNVANPLFEGDSLRGFYMLMKLQDNTTTNFSLFAVNFGFNYSRPNGI